MYQVIYLISFDLICNNNRSYYLIKLIVLKFQNIVENVYPKNNLLCVKTNDKTN